MAVRNAEDKGVSIREKRAQWEGFELSLLSPFTVLVRNVSHDDPEAHQYVVSVVEGETTSCTCRFKPLGLLVECFVENQYNDTLIGPFLRSDIDITVLLDERLDMFPPTPIV